MRSLLNVLITVVAVLLIANVLVLAIQNRDGLARVVASWQSPPPASAPGPAVENGAPAADAATRNESPIVEVHDHQHSAPAPTPSTTARPVTTNADDQAQGAEHQVHLPRRPLHRYREQAVAVATGAVHLTTRMPGVGQITGHYRVPVDAAGEPLPGAEDVVLILPFPTETRPHETREAKLLSDHYALSVLALEIPNQEHTEHDVTASDYYYYPETSGSGEAVWRALRRFQQRLGLEARNPLLYGNSGGGSFAHHFAEAYPEQVDGYVAAAARFFVEQPGYRGPALLFHGEYDGEVTANNAAAIQRMRAAGLAPTVMPYRPEYGRRGSPDSLLTHCINNDVRAMTGAWLAGLADLRRANGGTIPERERWPARGEDSPHTHHHAAWRDFLGSAHFPSPHALDAWHGMSPPVCVLSEQRWTQGEGHLAWPAADTPVEGLIVLAPGSFALDQRDLILDAEILSEHGYVVVAGDCNGFDAVPGLLSLLERLDATHAELPAMVVGYGTTPNHRILIERLGSRLHAVVLRDPGGAPAGDWYHGEWETAVIADPDTVQRYRAYWKGRPSVFKGFTRGEEYHGKRMNRIANFISRIADKRLH